MNDQSAYNPRFKLSNAQRPEPPKMTEALEKGLRAGWDFLTSVGEAVPLERQLPDCGRRPDWEQLRTFLDEQDLLVEETDKNLGVAVFSRQWYTKEALTQLEDDPYKPIHVRSVVDHIAGAKQRVGVPADSPGATQLTDQERKLLREGIEHHYDLLRWHGIPKVHRTP